MRSWPSCDLLPDHGARMSSDDGTEVETDDDSSGAPVDALNEGDAFERLIQVAAARRSAAGGPGGPAGRQPFTATVEDEGDRFVGGISPTHAVNEDDDDDEVFLSPRRRRGLGGGAGPARAPPSQPAFRRHSKGWITLEDGIVSEEDLDTAIAKHADKVSRGRGFTPAGSWRNGKNNGVSSRTSTSSRTGFARMRTLRRTSMYSAKSSAP